MIIWKKPDETLAVTHILSGDNPASHAKLLKKQKDVPADWVVAYAGAELPLPVDWVQEAWRFVDGGVVVDLEAARDVTKARLRYERDPLLVSLDIQFQRALETGNSTADIVAEKQRLRDLTTLADVCTTLDELKNLSV